MAVIYCSSVDGNDGDNGSTWALAKSTLAAAVTAAGVSGTVYLDSAHAESSASVITIAAASNYIKTRILTVDRTGDPEPPTTLATGATVTTTSNASISFNGAALCHGVVFTGRSGGNGSGVVVTGSWRFENCSLRNGSTGNPILGTPRPDANAWPDIELHNTSFSVTSTSSGLIIYFCNLRWTGNAFLAGGSATPTTAITLIYPSRLEMRGLDLTGLGANTLLNLNTVQNTHVDLNECILHSGTTLNSGVFAGKASRLRKYRSTSGTITLPVLSIDTRLYGTITETTAVYRTGGAEDGLQANAYSWGMVTNANAAEIYAPLVSSPLTLWADPDASISGATSKGIVTSTRCGLLATPVALTTDSSSTWNGSGVSVKQKVDHTLSNGETLTVYVASEATLNDDDFWIEVEEPDQVGGPVTVRCFLAKPSTTVYVDPKISGSRQFLSNGVQINEAGSGGSGIAKLVGFGGGLVG